MTCQRCKSERIVNISGKVSDLCFARIGDHEHDGYVPDDLGVGGGDYLDFGLCLDCGQLQGEFPREPTELEGTEPAPCSNT
jgi:hypothetical protein